MTSFGKSYEILIIKFLDFLILKHVPIFQERQRYLILWLGMTSFTLCGCLLIFIIRITSQATNTFKVIIVDMGAHNLQIYHKIRKTFYHFQTELQTSKIVAIILYFLLNIYFVASVEAYIRKINRRATLMKDIMVSARDTGTLRYQKYHVITLLKNKI